MAPKQRKKPGWRLAKPARLLGEIRPGSLYTAVQAARLLRMRDSRVHAEREAGRLPGRRDGHRWVFRGQHLLDWIDGRFPEGAAEGPRK